MEWDILEAQTEHDGSYAPPAGMAKEPGKDSLRKDTE